MPRPKSNRRTVRLSVTLDEGDYKVVRDMAEAMDLSTAWMVRRAVTEFIERHGEEDAMPLRNGDERAA